MYSYKSLCPTAHVYVCAVNVCVQRSMCLIPTKYQSIELVFHTHTHIAYHKYVSTVVVLCYSECDQSY